MKNFFSREIEEIFRHFQVDTTKGLSQEERAKRLESHGSNTLPQAPKPSLFSEFIDQLKNPIVILLLGTAIISLLTHHGFESLLIIGIVLFMAGVGVLLQRQSEKSLEKLKSLQTNSSTILSDGKHITVTTESIVPGDILILSEGDKIPADARVIETHDAKVDESTLTGESLPVSKHAHILKENTTLADQINMVFSGTAIVAGSLKAVVTATKEDTELGKITTYLNAQDVRLTPMQKELERVGNILLVTCLILVSVILVVLTFVHGNEFIDSLLTTISLAIAIVPEGLSAVMTVTLALAVKEMVKKKVIIKKLLAAEGLGSITHIATDKTGTITEGRMHVVQVYFQDTLIKVNEQTLQEHPHYERLINIIKFCNNNKGPTEQALVTFLDKNGYSYELEGRTVEYQFNSDDKRMSVGRTHNGRIHLFSKGAPDILIPLCSHDLHDSNEFTEEEKQKTLDMAATLASQGFRVLALADKEEHESFDPSKRHETETNLTFVGLVALIDPLRDTVKETVTSLKKAGVTPLMITGDHPAIAKYIATEAGIIVHPEKEIVLTGNDLDDLFGKIDFPEIKQKLLTARVFARVRPEHKVMIVELYQKEGYRIAMTGDGINDAAAIKRADVGIAMSNGMDVTKDISDVVITGTYDALIRAVSIGRTVKLRTQLYLQYLLSGNAVEVGIFLIAVSANLPNPLTPVLILVINILTDAMPAMAMAVEPEDPDITKRKVKKEVEGMISPQVVRGIAIQGITASLIIAYVFIKALPYGISFAQTIVFTFFVFHESLRGFTARSFTKSVFSYGFFSNKFMNIAVVMSLLVWVVIVYVVPHIFGMTPLSPVFLFELFLLSLIPPIIEEGTKGLNRFLLKRS
jgi:Ca2+-transporting ATPase